MEATVPVLGGGLVPPRPAFPLPPLAGFARPCGRTGYTGPTGRTGPCPDPSDPTAYCTHTSLAQLLASSSLLVEVILASSIGLVTN